MRLRARAWAGRPATASVAFPTRDGAPRGFLFPTVFLSAVPAAFSPHRPPAFRGPHESLSVDRRFRGWCLMSTRWSDSRHA